MITWRLFPIPMQCQGTADVESLPSYLLRSAYAHGASGGVLLQVIHELGGCSQKTKPRSIAGNAWHSYPGEGKSVYLGVARSTRGVYGAGYEL